MKPSRLVTRCRPAALLALAVFGLAVAGPAGPAPAALAAARTPQARVLNPGPPTGLTAVAGDGRVTLSWAAPQSNGGAAIIGYDVYEGTSPGGESASSVSGLTSGTSYTVSGLADGTTYYFTVDAVNDAQLHSVRSAEASARPMAPVTAPGAPGGLTAAAGDAQVSLSWQAPSSDGGAAITSYNVYQGGKKAATVTGTGATVKNLSNGTAYSFTVTAVNKAGEGPASRAASATPAAAITKPGAPNGLAASPGDGKVTLSWSPPKSTGGAAITSYNVYQGGKRAATVTGTGATVKNLSNGTAYSFTVTAVNQAGEGPASRAASATPAAAITKPGAPNGLAASPGDGKVTLAWSPPKSTGGAAITGYNVYQGGKKAATVTGTGATVKNLSNGTAYSFTVTAVNKAGEGPASGAASATPNAASASTSASTSASASASASASGSATASASASAGASASGSASSSVASAPAGGTGASGTPAGTAGASGQPTGAAVLASDAKKMPKPVLFTLAALALAAAGGVLTLTTRRLRNAPRKGRRAKRAPAAPPVDVRAVPEIGPPSPVSVHEFQVEHHELSAENHEVVMEETYTVRLEPLPAAIITTFEEISA